MLGSVPAWVLSTLICPPTWAQVAPLNCATLIWSLPPATSSQATYGTPLKSAMLGWAPFLALGELGVTNLPGGSSRGNACQRIDGGRVADSACCLGRGAEAAPAVAPG